VFVALREMKAADHAGFDAWLRERKPLFDAPLFKAAGLSPPPFQAQTPVPSAARAAPQTGDGLEGGDGRTRPTADNTGQPATEPPGVSTPAAFRAIPIGR